MVKIAFSVIELKQIHDRRYKRCMVFMNLELN